MEMKMENSLEIKEFVQAFFNNLKAEMSWEGQTLVINKVPASFEDFLGKKAPYTLVFEAGVDTNAELMTKGSFLLKAMTSYLENKGQTTLIKLDFDRDYKEEFKKYLKLKNSEIYSINKVPVYQNIVRFSFLTVLQYLNEKEQLMNTIYTQNGEVISFNLEKYKQLEGKKEELTKKEIKADYETAKEELKKILQNKIKETSVMLSKKLSKERKRITDHYHTQLTEIESSISKYKEQIINLEKQALKIDNTEKQAVLTKIEKLKETIKVIEQSGKKDKIDQEEKFFINDEIHKHSLDVNNKLMNMTIIYYPVFNFTLFFKNADSARQLELVYDPLQDKLNKPITCDACSREITEISLCSSGHLNCTNCIEKCNSCYKLLCKKCTKKECQFCSRDLCRNCSDKCSICFKLVCKSHLRNNYATGNPACVNCLQKCSLCNEFSDNNHIKKNTLGENICTKCLRLNSLKKVD